MITPSNPDYTDERPDKADFIKQGIKDQWEDALSVRDAIGEGLNDNYVEVAHILRQLNNSDLHWEQKKAKRRKSGTCSQARMRSFVSEYGKNDRLPEWLSDLCVEAVCLILDGMNKDFEDSAEADYCRRYEL